MRILLRCLFFWLLSISAGQAQSALATISGTVRDSATNQPLAGASVVVDFNNTVKGINTDAQGRFAFEVFTGNHHVVVRYVGYKPFRVGLDLRNDYRLNVNLVLVASQLEEVVVTSKGFDRNVRQPLLGVSQISVEMLRKLPSALGEVDLLRGIQMLPGVTSVGEAANGVNIRGGTTDQTLILLDDTPIFNPSHMFGLFSIFPADAVSGLDLYKGNVPARYGGRTASVMDIALRNPGLDKFRLTGGVSFVSNRLTADIPLVKDRLGVMVSGRAAFNDFLLPIVSPRLKGIKAQFGDFVVKGFWRINDRNTLTAMTYVSTDFFQTQLLGSIPNINATATQYDHRTVNAMARWLRVISPRLNLQTTVTSADYVPKILLPELNSTNKVVIRSGVGQQQLKSNLNYQTDNQKIEVGINATRYRLEPGSLLPGASQSVNPVNTPTENALELALYADDEWSVSPKLALSAGLRYSQFGALGPGVVRRYAPGEALDEFSVIDSTRYRRGQVGQQYGGLEPRLGLRYELTPNSSVKFGLNVMRQYLQVVTNTTTPLPTARWKTADAHIRPQISQLVTAGYFRNFKDNVYDLLLEGYYRTTQNTLDYKPGSNFLLQAYPETQLLQGRSRAYGVEMMVARKKGELTGWVNYTYARTLNQVNQGTSFLERINGGNWYAANYDRPHTLNASMTITVNKNNSFGFIFAYSSGRPYTAPNGFVSLQSNQSPASGASLSELINGVTDFGSIKSSQYPYYSERNQARLPAYHRLDFSWNITNPTLKNRRWQGSWAFTVYNLYARKNTYSAFFRTENGKTQAYQLQIFATPIPTLTYNFVLK